MSWLVMFHARSSAKYFKILKVVLDEHWYDPAWSNAVQWSFTKWSAIEQPWILNDGSETYSFGIQRSNSEKLGGQTLWQMTAINAELKTPQKQQEALPKEHSTSPALSGSINLYHDYIARFLKPAILLKTLVSRFRKHWSVPQTYIHTKKHLQTIAQVATAFVLPPAPTEDMTPTSRTQLNKCDSCSKPCSNVASWDHRALSDSGRYNYSPTRNSSKKTIPVLHTSTCMDALAFGFKWLQT